MIYITKNISRVQNFYEDNIRWGKIYNLDNYILINGYYLIKDNAILKETLHENFNLKWIFYWKNNRGSKFGGLKSDELEFYKNTNKIKILKRSQKCLTIKDNVVLFQYMYDHNFHHFIITSLPRLSFLFDEKYSDCKILIRQNTPKYQVDFIKYIFGSDRLIMINDDTEYEVKSLFIIPFYQWNNLKYIEQFYKEINSKFNSDENLIHKFYISRKDNSQKRPLINFNKLQFTFSKKKIKELLLSKYSIEERINLLKKTSILAGVFSAGFANIVFLSSGSKVIFIEHPLLPIPKEYKAICKYRGIKLVILNSGNSILKSLKIYLGFLFKNKINSDSINTNGWEVDILKLNKLLKYEKI